MAHLADYNTETTYPATIRKTVRLSPQNSEEVREIIIEVQDPEFTCKVDQSFGVLVPATGEFGNTMHHRLYSVADLPAKKKGKPSIQQRPTVAGTQIIPICWRPA